VPNFFGGKTYPENKRCLFSVYFRILLDFFEHIRQKKIFFRFFFLKGSPNDAKHENKIRF